MKLERAIFGASMAMLGAAIGIGICKFCPGVWDWIARGILR